jgi:hypothetical protein
MIVSIVAAFAYYPINHNIESGISQAPTQEAAVNELQGSVFVQDGAKNFGRWWNPGIKQQFSTRTAMTGDVTAGTLVWAINDAGPGESFGSVDVEVTLRFAERSYDTVVAASKLKLVANSYQPPCESDSQSVIE